MARKKSFSSELAHIYDSAIALAQEIKLYQETVSVLITNAEKYREVEPLLRDISRVEQQHAADNLPSMNGHHIEETPAGNIQQVEEPPPAEPEPKARTRHIKNKLTETPSE